MKKCFFLFFLMLSCTTASFAQSLMGDVNGDNKVDFKDVSEISNYIMGKPSAAFDETKADVNGDTKINAADLVRVINMAMVTLYDSYSLVVWKNDGTKDYYNINELPETTFGDYIHVVKTSGGATKAYDKEEVLRYSFSLKDNPDDPQPVQTQNAREAFYVYQNDGHFDGFFYDEVQKIAFSEVDTFGIAHEGIVSQEIVTADSTYRFMLTAIDSIGFVQPDIVYNSRLRKITYMAGTGQEFIEDTWPVSFNPNDFTVRIRHKVGSFLPELREDLYPQPGDVFANFDMTDGWSAKVVSVTEETLNGSCYVVAHCKPIDEITDIFQQLVCVEQYRHDDMGNLLSRRVAGRSDLNVGNVRTRAYDNLDYNLLNFSFNGHLPIYSKGDNYITLDTSIEGKVDLKIVYDLSFWGSKYIGITTDVSLGGSVGLTVDGKLGGVSTGGLSQLGQVPIPAPAPIITFLFGPDGFARAEGHFRASVSSPKLNTKFWLKFEIKDWKPSFDWGPGSLKDEKQEENKNSNEMGASLEINGFAQAGVAFPLKLQSLPVIGKLFNASIGGTWYVGPKFSAAFNIDLYNAIAGDNDAYGNLKETHVTLSPIDFDYEITAEVSALLSEKKTWTMADGSFSPAPTVDLKLFPDFDDCEVYREVSNEYHIDGTTITKDCYAFKPSGNLFMPMGIGACLYYLDENNKEKLISYQINPTKYWWSPGETKLFWPTYRIDAGSLEYYVTKSEEYKTGNFRFYPVVQVWRSSQISDRPGGNGDYINLPSNETTGLPAGIIRAKPYYQIQVDKFYKMSSDTLYVNYDGSVTNPVVITASTTADAEVEVLPDRNPIGVPEWFLITGEGKKYELSVDQKKFLEYGGKYHGLVDTLIYYNPIGFLPIARFGTNVIEDDSYPGVYVALLPNGNENPVKIRLTTYLGNLGMYHKLATCSATRENNIWHCTVDERESNEHFKLLFDMVETKTDWRSIKYTIKNMYFYYNSKISDEEYDRYEGTISDIQNVEGGGNISVPYGTKSCQITYTSKKSDNTTTAKLTEIPFQFDIYFQDYIDSHPEEFQ